MKKLFTIALGLLMTNAAFAWKVTTLRDVTGTVKMEVDVTHGSSQLDVLFVIDNSGSMSEYQQQLSSNIDALIGGLVRFDVNAAVVTTDMMNKPAYFVNGVLNSKNPAFLAQLRKDILQGTNGAAEEQLFAPVISALTPPLSLGANKDFLRSNANLVVVFLTDAEDQSNMPADEFVTRLKSLKANTAGTVSAVAIYSPDSSKCLQDNGTPAKLEKALAQLNAKTAAICDPQLSKSLTDIGDLLTGGMATIERKVKLPLAPALNTVKVTYGVTELQLGDFYQGWIYDNKTMMMMIGEEFDFNTEPAGTKLLIEYTPKEWIK